MRPFSANKLLGALLAVLVVGMGLQTYYLVRVHRELRAAEARAAEREARPGGDPSSTLPAPGIPSDPFAELDAAEERMQALFDDFQRRFDEDLLGAFGDRWPFGDGDSFLFDSTGLPGPRADLQDRGDRYELVMDIPGAEEADVTVAIEDGVLRVEGTRTSTQENSAPGQFLRRERQFGRFVREIALPEDADPSTLETELKSGVLTASIAKRGRSSSPK
jgi:HSP20 family molecular chaperone IbpA